MYNSETWRMKAIQLNPYFNFSNSIYKGSHELISAICKTCGKENIKPATQFLKRNKSGNIIGCSYCNKNHNFSNEEYIKLAKEHFPEYDYSFVNYINRRTEIELVCPIHGKFKKYPLDLLNNSGCTKCSGCHNYTEEEFREKLNSLYGINYDYSITKYINAKIDISFKCRKCGKIITKRPDAAIRGEGCKKCNGSSGEIKILNYLEKNNLDYLFEKEFDDLIDINKLSYDFYIKNYNLLIEFNGEQHYKFIPFYHRDLHKFHKQLHHDWLKREYAKKNKINLLVIPYWEYNNIDNILESRLKLSN